MHLQRDLRRRRAHGHADADFLGTLRHQENEYPEEPNGGQQGSDARKHRNQGCDKPGETPEFADSIIQALHADR